MRLRECFHRLRVDGRSKRIKKFAFTIVCVYNRLRVDGALFRFVFSLGNKDTIGKISLTVEATIGSKMTPSCK